MSKVLGIRSAFRLMPDEGEAFTDNDIHGTGNDGTEIDITESPFTYKLFNPYITLHAVHCDGYENRLKPESSPIAYLKSIYDDFHTYALECYEDEYIFYVDGYETRRINHLNGKELNKNRVISAWQGSRMKNDLTKHYDFAVDFVRIYKRK